MTPPELRLDDEDPLAKAAAEAVAGGDAEAVKQLLHEHPELATARVVSGGERTLLHWAASNDDVGLIDALLDAGADLEAPGAITGGRTPIADATAFGQWQAADRLLARGARTNLFEAAALGLNDRLQEELSTSPDPDKVTAAFWGACHGGRQSTASQLLSRGAELNWVGYDDLTAVDAAERSGANRLAAWLRKRGGRSAAELASSA